jgi:hypothetical protein
MNDLNQSTFEQKFRMFKTRIKPELAKVFLKIIYVCLFFGVLFSHKCQAHQFSELPITSLSENKFNNQKFLPTRLQNTLWWKIAKQHEVDPYILYAVALIESANSAGTTKVTPWPWAINKSGKSILSDSQSQAHTILKKLIAEGNRHIDIGLMQINLYWHGNRVSNPEDLLNPVTNLTVGAGLLAEAIQSSPNNLVLGIGRYHSWENLSSAVLYGRRVLAVAEQIKHMI